MRCFGTSLVVKILQSSESSDISAYFISSMLFIRSTYSVIKFTFVIICSDELTTDSKITLSVNLLIFFCSGL